jgi:non-specific serine/threonine protein kinase
MAFSSSRERYRFGAFELQLDERRLLKDGAPVSLRPRALDLLAFMVERAGHLVTKDELLEHVWPRVVVEDAVVHVQVSALRKILGNDSIATISGQGYRFALSVRKGAALPKHNLPSQLTSFIGREQEIAQLEELVISNRLTTLTGAGGVGKTRLALQVAGKLLDQFVDGVWLVELAALSDAGLVIQSVAQILGIKELPGKPLSETLSDHLASKQVLLVLDNAEHLLGACVELAAGILRRGARVSMLVTSRERLGMTGELTYRVPSLTVPDPEAKVTPEALPVYEGVRLFVERAKLLRPHFTITNDNAGAVASICHRLDGIPLAIELAAPRLRSMSVEEVSKRLDHRLALLTAGAHAPLPRHRTLRAMIDWSYDLLSDVEKSMLQRLAVFAGGWTLEAAEQVCTGDGIEASAVIDVLASLLDKSLIGADELDGTTRYRMLETIRHYAHGRLREIGEEAQWCDSHLAHFLALGERSFVELAGANQQPWLQHLAADHDNFRAALTWSAAATGKAEEGLRVAIALTRFWIIRCYLAEARGWLTRLLAIVPSTHPRKERARGLNMVGIFAQDQGDLAAADAFHREALALFRELDDPKGISAALNNIGCIAIEQARYSEAEAAFDEALELDRRVGDQRNAALTLLNLGVVARARGDLALARGRFEEALPMLHEIGDRHGTAEVLYSLGHVECEQGNYPLAEIRLRESVTMSLELADRNGIAQGLECLAKVAVGTDAPARAARLWGTAERVREEIGQPMLMNHRPSYNRAVAAARTALGDDAFALALREGREMTLEEAVRNALSGEDAPHRH